MDEGGGLRTPGDMSEGGKGALSSEGDLESGAVIERVRAGWGGR